MAAKKRVLAGVRASGRMHLGIYLGAVKGMIELQNDSNYETFYMVADLHGLTTPYDPEELRVNRREIVVDYLAAGLDPEKSAIFYQSDVGLHGELAFYLSSVMTVARMQHLPTYKDKVKQYPEAATMALLNYPILMASDILAYKADLVPVGLDQEPHLEVAREVARKMNDQYGLGFPEAKRFATKGEYVPSLMGEGKMSKSVEGSYINLTDDLAVIKKKLAGVPTDSGKGEVVPLKGGVAALLSLVELFIGSGRKAEYEADYVTTGIRYKGLKEELAELIYKELLPIQESREQILSDEGYVDFVLKEGCKRAQEVVMGTLDEVQRSMGLKGI